MNRDELGALYDAHADALYGLLVSLTRSEAEARDLLHDLFVKVGRGIASVSEIEHPRAYLLRAAHRMAIDASRRRETRTRNESTAAAEKERAAPVLVPEGDPDRETFRDALEEALQELPIEQRAVVHLKLWEDLTFAEIAEALGLSPNTAASRYRYGVDKLRARLRPLYDEIR